MVADRIDQPFGAATAETNSPLSCRKKPTMNIRLIIVTGLALSSALWAMPGTARGQIIYESDNTTGTVGEYNLDGTPINASLITGLNQPLGIAVAGNNLYVITLDGGTIGTVREYNATTGAVINPSLLTQSQDPYVLALSGNNLYVVSPGASGIGSGLVGVYDATTGAAIHAPLLTGLIYPVGVAISGNNLYLPQQLNGTFGQISIYDATTGAAVSNPLISGLLHAPEGLLVSGNMLYEANAGNGTIGLYNATTGATINGSFISGLDSPSQLALYGNELFVSNVNSGAIGVYDATTGAAINASLISGLSGPFGIAAVPEPSTWTGGFLTAGAIMYSIWRKRRRMTSSSATA